MLIHLHDRKHTSPQQIFKNTLKITHLKHSLTNPTPPKNQTQPWFQMIRCTCPFPLFLLPEANSKLEVSFQLQGEGSPPTRNVVLFLEPWVRKNANPNDICFTFPTFLEVWDYFLLIFRPHHFVYFLDTIGQPFAHLPLACFTTSSNLLIMLKVATTAFRSTKNHQFIDCSWVFSVFVGFKTWNDQCSCPPVLSFGVRL